MLLKGCTQYASKSGKLSSGRRIGKSRPSFQFQRKAKPKNLQVTIQWHSFHMLARLCSDSFKIGLSSTWTKNLQMYKLYLEKTKEQEIKFQHPLDHRQKKKKSTSTSLTMLKPLTVRIPTNCEKLFKRWEYQTTLSVSWEACIQDKK